MVVRVAVLVVPLLLPHELEGAVGDHLVRVHVRGGARAALEDVEAEFVVELARDDLLAGPLDALQDLLAELAAVEVRARGRELDHRECLDEVRVEPKLDARDVEVLQSARGLDSVVRVGGNGEIPEQVMLEADGGFRCHRSSYWPARMAACRRTPSLVLTFVE